jgi:hypothetical protein
MAEFVTNRAKLSIGNGDTPLDTADLRMAYVVGAGVSGISLATFQDLNFVSELDAIASVTISTERLTLTGEAVAEDDTNNWALADFDNATFGAVAETAEGVIIYKEGASDAARELLYMSTTGFPQPVNGGLNVNTPNGWLRLT